jgi:hypothetical protein
MYCNPKTTTTWKGKAAQAVLSLSLTLAGLTASPATAADRPGLSDWTPRKGTLTYDRDWAVENGSRSGHHTAKTCEKFQSLFGPKSPLEDRDVIWVDFSKDCHLTSMITIKKMVVIRSVADKEAKNRREMDLIYNQSPDKSAIEREPRFESRRAAIKALDQTYDDARSDKERDAIVKEVRRLDQEYDADLSLALHQAYGDPIGSSVNRRKAEYGPAFVCRTNAAPCFLIDLPFVLNPPKGRFVRFIGLRFTAGEGQYAELIQARSGGAHIKDNLFEGMRTATSTDQGEIPDSNHRGPSLVLLQNEYAIVEGNAFVGGYGGVELYPYKASPSPNFSNAFEVSRNILVRQAFTGLDLDGTYRNPRYSRDPNELPAVAVDIFGNAVVSSAVSGLKANTIRAAVFQNLFDGNQTHIELGRGEVTIDRNIMRDAATTAIDGGLGEKVYISANLFENNNYVITGMASLTGQDASIPSDNICKGQPLDSFIPWDDTPVKSCRGKNRKECKAWKKIKADIEGSDRATKSKVVNYHVLFNRIFYLSREEEYDRCFNYEAVYGSEATDTLSILESQEFWNW